MDFAEVVFGTEYTPAVRLCDLCMAVTSTGQYRGEGDPRPNDFKKFKETSVLRNSLGMFEVCSDGCYNKLRKKYRAFLDIRSEEELIERYKEVTLPSNIRKFIL